MVSLFGETAFTQTIRATDRRAFANKEPFIFDIDGDGRPDKIFPHIYVVHDKSRGHKKSKPILLEQHWIAFDIQLATGGKTKNVFRYQYGTNEADYWCYALIQIDDLNKDGRKDLMFYAGDDTTEERIWLLNLPGKFKTHKRRVNEIEKGD